MNQGPDLKRRSAAATADFVTVIVAGQTFGLPISAVHDVFIAETVTPVPLAPVEVVGLLNLRGRVVTALCLRRLLRLPVTGSPGGGMVVGIEHEGESFGLAVDGVGEVLTLPIAEIRPNPMNLDPRWAQFSRGIYWLDEGLVVIVDIGSVFDPQALSHGADRTAMTRGQAA